jgi:hypothetical protein
MLLRNVRSGNRHRIAQTQESQGYLHGKGDRKWSFAMPASCCPRHSTPPGQPATASAGASLLSGCLRLSWNLSFKHRSKLLGFHMSLWPLNPIYQIKRYGEGQRKEVYHMAWDMPWEEAK